MSLLFFNTLSRQLENFVPSDPDGKTVKMYCCGPTVHDYAHIGNFRTFIFADLVRRLLEFHNYNVRHVMNITDVEDKIIQRIQQPVIPLRDYTAKYEGLFLEDFRTLNCLAPHEMPRATEHISDIIQLIERLVARGVAYKAADGSVYFSISGYQKQGGQYGQLVKLNFEEMRPDERIAHDDYQKEAVADFALWKARVAGDGDVFWESPWGQGRPGWHIECSAMSMKCLSASFDLHLGGEDLMFPHHEDEIAQSEGSQLQAPGHPFVRYWMHGAHLLVEGKKMSKSLGNYFTLRDLLEKGYSGREIRYLLLSAHYREQFNFTTEGLRAARTALGRIDECLQKLREFSPPAGSPADESFLNAVSSTLDNDLNVSGAWGLIFEAVRELNKKIDAGTLTPAEAGGFLAAWDRLNLIFGIPAPDAGSAPQEIEALLAARLQARKDKDFKRADALRDEMKGRGWVVEDTAKGPKLKRI